MSAEDRFRPKHRHFSKTVDDESRSASSRHTIRAFEYARNENRPDPD